jgi:hypothetical protein
MHATVDALPDYLVFTVRHAMLLLAALGQRLAGSPCELDTANLSSCITICCRKTAIMQWERIVFSEYILIHCLTSSSDMQCCNPRVGQNRTAFHRRKRFHFLPGALSLIISLERTRIGGLCIEEHTQSAS